MGPLLSVQHISVTYEDAQGQPLLALGDVSFSLQRGEFVCIVGPSGCGKTTLLRVIGGLQQPSHGVVTLFDESGHANPHGLTEADVGFVFQKVNLMPWRTVLKNVALPLEVKHIPEAMALDKARYSLTRVGLEPFADAYPSQLSGGMGQRAALARALVGDPCLLLMDEPLGALDALARETMGLELLKVWQATRQTAVMVTHSIPEAVFLADRVLVMTPRPGRLALEVPVPLPRPRLLEMMGSEQFASLAQQVRNAISSQ